MKLLQATCIVLSALLVYYSQAAYVPSKGETITPHSNEDMVPKFKETQKESHSRKEGIPVAHDSEKSHTVTARSLPNSTVTECYKKITGYVYPFYIQIVGSEAFLTEYGTRYVHVLDVKTGLTLRKFAVPVGHPPTGLFVKGNRVLVTDHNQETYSFSLNGDLFGVHYSNQPVAVAVDYNGLMYTTEGNNGKINVFNIDGSKSHVISIGKTGYLRKIQFDKQGNLYTGHFYSKVIYVFDRRGSLIRSISVPAYVEGIHLDPYDETIIYVADRKKGAGKVLKVKIATGEVIKTYSGLTGASDIAVAPDGKLWVVDFEGGSIRIYHEEN